MKTVLKIILLTFVCNTQAEIKTNINYLNFNSLLWNEVYVSQYSVISPCSNILNDFNNFNRKLCYPLYVLNSQLIPTTPIICNVDPTKENLLGSKDFANHFISFNITKPKKIYIYSIEPSVVPHMLLFHSSHLIIGLKLANKSFYGGRLTLRYII